MTSDPAWILCTRPGDGSATPSPATQQNNFRTPASLLAMTPSTGASSAGLLHGTTSIFSPAPASIDGRRLNNAFTPSRHESAAKNRVPLSELNMNLNNQGQRPTGQALQGQENLPLVNNTRCNALIPHPHGVIGDRRLSVIQETTDIASDEQPLNDYVYHRASVLDQIMDSNANTQITSSPAQTTCSLSLANLSLAPVRQPMVPQKEPSIFAGHDVLPSMSVQNDGNIPPIFKPMSNLFATGLQYMPEPYEVGASRQDPVLSTTLPMMSRDPPTTDPSTIRLSDIDKMAAGFSPRYMGDILLRNNQSENIPDDQNCSLFIVNLPAQLTVHELLGAIHRLGPTGRIYAVHINGPEPARGHPGCAAKVVFFRRDVAHDFYARCAARWPQTGPGLQVGDHMARVMWNRIRTSERPHLAQSNASRVLLIAGPPEYVNPRALTAFFASKLQFQTDRVLVHVEGGAEGAEDAVVEYRFGSFRCQAQAARLALQRERPQVRCFFGADPLEPCAWKPLEYLNFEKGG